MARHPNIPPAGAAPRWTAWRALALATTLSGLSLLAACTVEARRSLTPETIGVSFGGGFAFDRDNPRGGPRSLGCSVAVTPVWRIKPAPVAKVAIPRSNPCHELAFSH